MRATCYWRCSRHGSEFYSQKTRHVEGLTHVKSLKLEVLTLTWCRKLEECCQLKASVSSLTTEAQNYEVMSYIPHRLYGSVGDADHYVFACSLTKDFHLSLQSPKNAKKKKAWFQICQM
ncbi:hypothetical protein TNCV_2362941 [Trichonephila clavipes]|nr:hypothetical protein TNCV_2362941 [Trichonephila clavipes]